MADNFRFSPDAIEGGVVWMSPQQYLALSPSMKDPHAGEQAQRLKDSLTKGEPIDAAPSLKIKDGAVIDQDGRHRALAAQEAGIRMIPVKVDGDIPKDGKLVGMMGKPVQLDAGSLAPKPWSKVVRNKEYQQLDEDGKERVKRQYFEEVIAPRVSKADRERAAEQFQAATGARVPPTRVDPTEGMSTTDKLRAGAGKAYSDMLLGARGLSAMLPDPDTTLGKVTRTALHAVPGVGVIAGLPPTKPGEVADTRREDAPLMATGAGRTGNVAGTLALAAPTAVLPGANTVTGAGLYGAIYGGLQPAETGEERATNALLGGAWSAGLTGAARGSVGVYKALVDPFRGAGQERIALDTIDRFAKDPNWWQRAGEAAELVPGSKPSLAEATGDPGIAQLQRAAMSASPETASAMAESRTARLAARKNALLSIAGDDYEKEFFEAARDATAKRLYGEAFKAPLDPQAVAKAQPEIKALLLRPSIQDARADAIQIAAEEGVKLTPKNLGDGSIQSLHYMKKALDSQISKAKAAGDSAQASRLLDTQKKLLGVMDDLSPDYKAARATYAADSRPISRMEIGRYMYDKLVPALTDLGAERTTPQKFAETLKQGDVMAQRATGFKGAKLRDILSPDDMTTLTNLGLDLGRETRALEAGKVPGSPTAQYLAGQNVLRQVTGPMGMPNSWAESLLADTLANRAMSFAVRPVEDKVQNRLASLLLNPQEAAKAAAQRAAWPQSGGAQAIDAAARYALPPAAIGGANALTAP